MRIGRSTEALPLAPPDALGPAGSESAETAATPSRASDGPEGSASHGAGAVSPHPFSRLLRGLGQELDRGENLAEKAIRGAGGHASLSPERLIALQAGIYRYSEAVDLVTKLVDRGTQAVRTTLQNQ